jgi:hypothetical protein
MSILESDIEKLNKNFYDKSHISDYIDSPCIYYAYVGEHDLDYCLNKMKHVINATTLPHEEKYIKEIEQLKHKNEIITEKYNHAIEMNQQLRDNLNDLRQKSSNKLKNKHLLSQK